MVKYSFGLVTKRGLILGAVPPSLVPAYRAGQKGLHKLSNFCKQYWGALFVALLLIGLVAYAHKNHGTWLDHPQVKRRRALARGG